MVPLYLQQEKEGALEWERWRGGGGGGGWSVEPFRMSPAAPGVWGLCPLEEGMLGMETGNKASRGAPGRAGSTGRKFMGCVEIKEGGKRPGRAGNGLEGRGSSSALTASLAQSLGIPAALESGARRCLCPIRDPKDSLSGDLRVRRPPRTPSSPWSGSAPSPASRGGWHFSTLEKRF